ncbi:MAG TPA: DNA polymerase III subunit epsilon [Alphaproteobacteria bacterium]|nr:DNA polymerase III subunit epsilon [Alphaproteobacteria bacterium]
MSQREIIFDTETTGFGMEEGKILEIGCIEMVNRLPTGKTFHTYLNPGMKIDWQSQRVHGITDEKVADAPKFADIAAEMLAFFGDSTLVAHNADFDVGFVNTELKRAGLPPLTNPVVDTVAMARQKLPGQRASLDALCSFYNIDNSARTFHGALLDAQLLADVYVELTGGLQGNLLADIKVENATVTQTVTLAASADNAIVIEPSAAEAETHADFIARSVPNSGWNS